MVIWGWKGLLSVFALYSWFCLKKRPVACCNRFNCSLGFTAINMVRGLKAEKLLVTTEKQLNERLKESTAFNNPFSFSSSIQKGGIIVMWAGDFKPTLQSNLSSIKFL